MRKIYGFLFALLLALGIFGTTTTTNASAKNLKTVPTSIRGHWYAVTFDSITAYSFSKNGYAVYGPSDQYYTNNNGSPSSLKKWKHLEGHIINKSFTVSSKKDKSGYYVFKIKGFQSMHVKTTKVHGQKAIRLYGGGLGKTFTFMNSSQFKAYTFK